MSELGRSAFRKLRGAYSQLMVNRWFP